MSKCRRQPTAPAVPGSDESQAESSVCGWTVTDLARRYRVGEDKVRGWIARGELVAVNTAEVLCAKPRWVVMPEALTAFERRRAGGPPPKSPARRRRQPAVKDYYPEYPG
jgi:hypothetical protein